MKSIKYLILVVLIGLTVNSQGDITLTRTIQTSHIITNVKDFPDVTFFAVFKNSTNIFPSITGFTGAPYSEKIVDDASIGLNGSHLLNSAEIYAVKNEYLTGKENKDIDWQDKRNVLKSNIVIPADIDMAQAQLALNDVKLVENKYTIAGFNDSTIVYKVEHIYKFKEKLQKADSIKWDDYVDSEEILSKTF